MAFSGNIALGFWWVLFFSFHSILASGKVKAVVYNFGQKYRVYYRAGYNTISTLLLIPVLFTYINSASEWVFLPNTISLFGGGLLVLSGGYIIVDSFKNYNTAEFLGTYQIKSNKEYKATSFSKHGWNNIVRHPLYFGSIVLILGLFTAIPNQKMALSATLGLVYLIIGTFWEEMKLKKEFGQSYCDYQEEVSMLLPIKYLMKQWRR
jgi:protein-S-isoprenylcysteine O-methyltransferase Ste14